jgi:hypothetical protein
MVQIERSSSSANVSAAEAQTDLGAPEGLLAGFGGRILPACCLGLWLLVVGSCTTTYAGRPESDDRVGDVVGQPFRDISLVRENPPEILKRAVAAPYFLPDKPECGAIVSEISELDRVLGPDVDTQRLNDGKSGVDATGLATNAIGDVIGLPFRGVVRKLSGAEQSEKALANAILSGMARRAYLKGVAYSAGCAGTFPD